MEIKNLTQMYIGLRDPVFSYLLRISGSYEMAEDLTQETFYRAILALPRFRGESSIKTWLYSIARNTYLRKLRDEKQGKTEELDGETLTSPVSAEIDPPTYVLQAEQKDALDRAIGSLPENYRTVLVLREFEELSCSEIAVIMDRTENWVRVTLFRAKQRLKEIYIETERGESIENRLL